MSGQLYLNVQNKKALHELVCNTPLPLRSFPARTRCANTDSELSHSHHTHDNSTTEYKIDILVAVIL